MRNDNRKSKDATPPAVEAKPALPLAEADALEYAYRDWKSAYAELHAFRRSAVQQYAELETNERKKLYHACLALRERHANAKYGELGAIYQSLGISGRTALDHIALADVYLTLRTLDGRRLDEMLEAGRYLSVNAGQRLHELRGLLQASEWNNLAWAAQKENFEVPQIDQIVKKVEGRQTARERRLKKEIDLATNARRAAAGEAYMSGAVPNPFFCSEAPSVNDLLAASGLQETGAVSYVEFVAMDDLSAKARFLEALQLRSRRERQGGMCVLIVNVPAERMDALSERIVSTEAAKAAKRIERRGRRRFQSLACEPLLRRTVTAQALSGRNPT